MTRRPLIATLVFAVAAACLIPGSASAGALRVAVYPPAIRAMAQTESWYHAVYVDDRVCWRARHAEQCFRLSAHEQHLMTRELSDLPRFTFVSKPEGVIKRSSGVEHHGVLVSLGLIHLRPPLRDRRRAVVEVSGYCGNLCGHFVTYKVVEGPWRWRVVGTVGGIGIA
jgi:hypothetical protein